ncbi:helix-turn-helix domain-containing protein [Phascolarctobacterium faecium]|uniref:helix-turn-helix domain-containing protein n=1 Tax=Phascolarctobacterium faecium TaxID=33025 RepID=UPI003AB5284A
MTINKFGANMKKYRTALGLSFAELSTLIDVSAPTLQRYESGKIKNVPYENILRLAEIFNCRPNELVGWDNYENDSNREDKNSLEYIFNMLSEQGQKKFLDYLYDLQNNPDNIDSNQFVKDIFINGINNKALEKRKKLAHELHILTKQEKSIMKEK